MANFRELTAEEQEALFAVYFKYKGNKTQMEKSGEAGFNRNIISQYEKQYDFKNRMLRKIAEEVNEEIEISKNILLAGKRKAIEQAINLLEVRKTKTINMATGKPYTKYIYPTNKDVKAAWEIIKVELGEPINITKNNNVNEEEKEELDKMRKDLDSTIKYVKTSITGNNPPSTGDLQAPAE